jgi:hypothetical protein
MYSFSAFAFHVCKKCYYDPKNIFHEKYQYGYKNAEFYAPKKIKCKKYKKFEKRNTQNLHVFLAVALFRAFV